VGLRHTGETFPDDIVSIIMNNTGTKLFFRNTDVDTRDRLEKLIPLIPQMPSDVTDRHRHIVGTRPISTLGVGECYYILPSGEWGRGAVKLKELQEEVEPQTGKPKMAPQSDEFVEHENGESDERKGDKPVEHSTRRLMGGVNNKTIIKLCDEIDLDIAYFHYWCV
jgi:hypothetical protein